MIVSIGGSEPQWLGLDIGLWLNAASIIIGVIVAVAVAAYISPKLAANSARRDSQERLLRVLLNTWQTPANPEYQSSIALIPLDFKGQREILTARQKLLDGVNIQPPDDQIELEKHHNELRQLQSELIAAIAKALDFDITSESLIAGAYMSKGFVDRENLILGALVAWQRIAHALERNNEMFAATLAQPRSELAGLDG